ncbi:hypothetical protein CPU12_03430 [Malaciobacter molluscorum LMG 25693]|uniref:Campylo_MOMP domain-containing protein n=1 Tax=Malaciobacter molluscorum LMG 25693 TaxID=870501 RepID=A0A2G1DK79_9BACT|nr:major outer membrane protein [Malaciobacter molluscorum]AXX91323.1 Campylo_MOMP domain-containing protein [Malaciobacter molluscorum LMG 25693]PHO18923.1 hypothetical protein CPU12_03430 [Malaciobacter molluscorum LMG 25693]
MKKFAKMSLVAAVAVAGLTTTSSAKALEDAIKNVDVSGTVVYRYDDTNYDNQKSKDAKYRAGDASNNKYKIALTAKAKVNEDVTAVTRFIVGSNDDAGFASLNTTTQGDSQVDVTLSQVYFSYTGLKNTTINFGKQGLTTPWTVAIDADGNEQTGTGILALTNLGPVTLAAAYFNQTNLGKSGDILNNRDLTKNPSRKDYVDTFGDKDIATVGIMGNIGPVALDAWYLNMQDVLDSYTIGALAKFNVGDVKLSIGARHTYVDLDDELQPGAEKIDNSLTKIELGAKLGIFGANINYGWTDDEGGIGAMDNSAKTNLDGWNLTLNGKRDADFLMLSVDAQVLPSLNVALKYNRLDQDQHTGANTEDLTDEEYYIQTSYQMSKNFGGYIRFGKTEIDRDSNNHGDDNDGTVGRLQVQYSF